MTCNRVLAVMLVAGMLAGCAQWRQMSDTDAQRLVGAEPLEQSYLGASLATISNADADAKKNWIGAVAADSLHKCQSFTARLAVGQIGSDLALDLATLTLAGISAVTVPARSAHILAAAAGITAGTRAAIDTDVFARNAAPYIVQQLSKTYFASMNSYLTGFPPPSIVPGAELAKIQAIHSSCSLELALAGLGNGPQGPAPPIVAITTLLPNQSYTTAGGLVYQITGSQVGGKWPVKIYQSLAPDAATTYRYDSGVLLQILNSSGAVLTPGG